MRQLAYISMSAYSTISLFTISPPTNPTAIVSNPMEENQLRPRSVDDRTRSMPTGFSPNPVSTTRKPSRQTRWKKISFALARLRPSSEYADWLLTESRLANPTAIGSNPMEENQLRPRSVETELRLCRRASYRIPSRQPDDHRVKPDGRKSASPSLG